MRGYGTKLVWNSVTSTFNAPSNRRDAVSEEITCAMQTVQVGVRRALDVQRPAADVVHGFVVQHHRDVGVLEQRVRGQHGVVRLDDRGGDLRAMDKS